MYGAIDAAVIDAYLTGALLDPSQPVGATQACVKTDNSLGTRPSPLANPPLAAAAIAQRERLVEALAAYEVATASLASGAPPIETALALSDFKRAAFELSAAARAHPQDNLYIEEPAATLVTAAGQLNSTRDQAGVRRIVADTNPTIVKLFGILGSDVAQRRTEATNAARLDYERWLAYYDAVRLASTVGGATPHTMVPPAPTARCLGPAVPRYMGPPGARDVANDGATFAGRDAILARLQSARRRYDALQKADPRLLVAALSDLNDAVTKALAAPGDAAAAAALQGSLLHFRNTAVTLATSLRQLAPLR